MGNRCQSGIGCFFSQPKNMTLINPTKKKYKKIGLVSKKTIGDHLPLLKKIIKTVEKYSTEIVLDDHIAPLITGETGLSKKEVFTSCDLVILLGGDGTILKSAGCTGKKITPILGVNLGTLGFLSEITAGELEQALKLILENKYFLDKRSILRVTKYHQNNKVATFLALNDAVINQGIFARLIELEIEIDQKKVVAFKADGLIVATPTGSTAHSLSAGGPIVHPGLDAILITPICPSTLALRPIVIPNDRLVKVRITTRRRGDYNLGLTLDGQVTVPLEYGDEINIRKSSRNFYMIRIKEQNYYKLLRDKLGWGYTKNGKN